MTTSVKSSRKVSLVIPTLNEEKNLSFVLNSIPKFIDEVIVVDGYSNDGTVDIAKRHGCKILYDNKGKGSALRQGIKEAKGDIIITMDADCSNSSNELILFIAGIEAGYDICMGSRFIQGGGSDDITLLRYIGNKFFAFLVNIIWRKRYSDLCYGYRSFSKEAASCLDLECDDFGIETEISIKAAKRGLKILEVPSFEKRRKEGEGKLKTFKDGFSVLKRIVKEITKK